MLYFAADIECSFFPFSHFLFNRRLKLFIFFNNHRPKALPSLLPHFCHCCHWLLWEFYSHRLYLYLFWVSLLPSLPFAAAFVANSLVVASFILFLYNLLGGKFPSSKVWLIATRVLHIYNYLIYFMPTKLIITFQDWWIGIEIPTN